ncbi:hypothetical protein SNOG_03932 [Parastagonospora nodorum SN15]|uniref:C2H2-type domain-containing protein n=1 Tax=Phaeosphaeria nodorum (strain SN15 / ATCC MYA-4574 / FGSC 10173) TaxID=321614 RepID=Q0UWD2_PHANO|nr:hypothetical protein SNOG_03932 [Parastagonospora nodorum SN15]EAT89137.2 hypothetical protein SNOG_03932 [Parastagonospora nodorum SN15]
MATTTRAITPTHTGPFAVPNGPTTPGAGARNSHGAPTFGTHLTNSPRGLSPRHSPQPVPGAMSLSDERQYRQSTPRQMSPHPVTTTSPRRAAAQIPHNCLHPQARASESMPKPAIVIPAQTGVTGENMQTSPVSLSSFGDDAPGAPAAAGDLEASVGPKNGLSQETVSQQPQHQQNHHQLIAPNPGDNPGNRAFTFPGERPHTCFKCGRRFARGDALARHNKGQGGCAGRRSSFGMDDELAEGKDGDMDGVVYTGEHDGDGDEDDDGGRRVSEPARKRQNTGSSAQGQSNVFAQGGMTESPKPLSPRQQEQHRLGTRDNSLPGSRSPNMSHHILHQGLARGAGRGTPPMALAPPNANNGPHLPSLPGLNPLASKQGSQSGKSNGPSLLQHQAMAAPPSTASQPGSISSHGGSGSSMREVIGGQVDVWQYVREMEARMARTEKEHTDMIATLQNEVTTLRAQLAQQHVNSSQAQQQGP